MLKSIDEKFKSSPRNRPTISIGTKHYPTRCGNVLYTAKGDVDSNSARFIPCPEKGSSACTAVSYRLRWPSKSVTALPTTDRSC